MIDQPTDDVGFAVVEFYSEQCRIRDNPQTVSKTRKIERNQERKESRKREKERGRKRKREGEINTADTFQNVIALARQIDDILGIKSLQIRLLRAMNLARIKLRR